jgi:hypothetical protein
MESTAFFEKKINLTPGEFNEIKREPIDTILERKAKQLIEKGAEKVELEAKKVKVVTDESLLMLLVFELAHLQLLQGMSCLKFD